MSDADFRWRAFFQRSTDPLFLLNRQGYLLFANSAWENLTRLSAAEARRLSCRRPQPVAPHQSWKTILAHVLTPTPEVHQGHSTRVRRLIPSREGRPTAWWDVDFFPIADGEGVRGILGKILVCPGALSETVPPLPETISSLRRSVDDALQSLYLESRVPAMQRLGQQMRLAARELVPLVLVGERGTGKKSLAHWIHTHSACRDGAFAALDCERLPASAIANLLFAEFGSIARAPIATLYLRQPDCLPRDLQARLHEIWRDGQAQDSSRGPRLMAGFGTEPSERIRAGALLEEWYQALQTMRLDLPSLRERRDDLPHLVDRLLLAGNAVSPRAIRMLSPDAWEMVFGYRWPDNLRELRQAVLIARQQAETDVLDAKHFPFAIRQAMAATSARKAAPETKLSYDDLIHKLERHLIQRSLRQAGGNRSKAAEGLGLSRARFLRRMQELGLNEANTDASAD